jgi:hypothetical protein
MRRSLLPALLLAARAARAQLQLAAHANGVLGAPAELSTSADVSLPAFDARAPFSAAFSGTLAPAAAGAGGAQLLAFSARTSGVVRAWVDDHLVLDDNGHGCNRSVASWNGWPAPAGSGPVPFRLEFTHDAAACADAPPVLELSWSGNTTALAAVPPAAFGPSPLSGPRAELAALKARLYEPLVPWQTYWAPSMGAHSLQPTGLLLQLSVGEIAPGGAYLGDIRVFPELAPAWVRAGGHSWNGSDYTAVHVSRWGATRNATVSIFTTAATASGAACSGTEGSGAPRCDLVAVAACEGADCGGLGLVVSAAFAWAGSGSVSANASVLTAAPDGDFSATLAFSITSPAVRRADAGGEDGASGARAAQPRTARAIDARPRAAATGAASALPPNSLVLPFSTRASLPWPGTGGGAGLLVAAVSTGAPRELADAVALVAAARGRYDAQAAGHGGAAAVVELYEPMRAVLAWNTLYAHFVGVYTPVTRNWYSGDDIGTFVWDVYFAAVMMATDAGDARATDLACMNVITTTLSRTMSGMVPNYISGASGTYDRTEPAVGAWAVRVLRDRLPAVASWLPALLIDSLAAWNDWFDSTRRNGGVLAASGAGGRADAISLGSGATSPAGLNTPNTLAAARYESGLDNSPQYDGDDGLCSGPSCPCRFNATSGLMNLYDVAFTSYYAIDADSIADLAGVLGRADLLPRMRDRSARAAAVLNGALWSAELGSYVNVLSDSGAAVPRWAPTVFSPMFAGVVPRARIDAIMALAADPAVFCLNASHEGSGGAASALLLQIGAPGAAAARACVSDACLVEAVLENAGAGVLLQAIVQNASGAASVASADLLPLTLFEAASLGGASALATPALAPTDPGFEVVRVEGYCFAQPSAIAPMPLTLWHRAAVPGNLCASRTGSDFVGADIVNKSTASPADCCAFCKATPGCALWKTQNAAGSVCYLKGAGATSPVACPDCVTGSAAASAPAYATCGTAACNASAAAAGLAPVGAAPMCWASAAAAPADWPCAIGLPAIGRSDAAFADQTYWRGRAWAPQAFLTWLALKRYEDVPSAVAARAALVDKAQRAFLRQLSLFGQVNENLDGLTGLGSDSARADSYYTWGALNGFIGLVELGVFPADVLVAAAPTS